MIPLESRLQIPTVHLQNFSSNFEMSALQVHICLHFKQFHFMSSF